MAANASKAKLESSFMILPPNLTQLVDDRLDEEQYDQAIELLNQLHVHGIQPGQAQIRKLFALSLCSLGAKQVASTSRWTLHDQQRDLFARSLPDNKGANVLDAASKLSDRPSESAVLRATELLFQYATQGAGSDLFESAPAREASTRYILECLPSQRLHQQRSERNRRAESSDYSGVSSVARWVEERMLAAEDVWDFLAEGHFTSQQATNSRSCPTEFWMAEKDQRRYTKQINVEHGEDQQMNDKLADRRRRKYVRDMVADSDTDDSSSSDAHKSLVMPKRGTSAKSPHPGATQSIKQQVSKRRRTDTTQASEIAELKLTEGAWRTLAVITRMWEIVDDLEAESDEPTLLWQFKNSRVARPPTSHSRRSATALPESTDQIDRALDVAMSFPQIVVPYSNTVDSNEPTANEEANSNGLPKEGNQRLVSEVTQLELEHRQQSTLFQRQQQVVRRAMTASNLLAGMYSLVRRKHIQHAAFVEGCAERLKAMSVHDIKGLCLALSLRQPIVVVKMLVSYLQECTRPHPDHLEDSSNLGNGITFEGDLLCLPGYLAFAVPSNLDALNLRHGEERERKETEAVIEFLQQKKIKLTAEFRNAFPLSFPSKAELSSDAVNSASKPRSSRYESTSKDTARSERNKADKLKVLAFIRFRHISMRNSVNQLKFVLLQSLVRLCPTSSTSSETDASKGDDQARAQRRSGAEMLRQLIKAYDKDLKDFTSCLLALKTHLGVRHYEAQAADRKKDGEGFNNADQMGALIPSLQLTISRCQGFVEATKILAQACRNLTEELIDNDAGKRIVIEIGD